MTRLYTRLNTPKMTRLIQHLIGLIVGSPIPYPPFHPDLAGRFIAGLEAVPRGHFGEGARAAAAV